MVCLYFALDFIGMLFVFDASIFKRDSSATIALAVLFTSALGATYWRRQYKEGDGADMYLTVRVLALVILLFTFFRPLTFVDYIAGIVAVLQLVLLVSITWRPPNSNR